MGNDQSKRLRQEQEWTDAGETISITCQVLVDAIGLNETVGVELNQRLKVVQAKPELVRNSSYEFKAHVRSEAVVAKLGGVDLDDELTFEHAGVEDGATIFVFVDQPTVMKAALDATGQFWRCVCGSNIRHRVRTEPNLQAPTAASLRSGDVVVVRQIDEEGIWAKVETGPCAGDAPKYKPQPSASGWSMIHPGAPGLEELAFQFYRCDGDGMHPIEGRPDDGLLLRTKDHIGKGEFVLVENVNADSWAELVDGRISPIATEKSVLRPAEIPPTWSAKVELLHRVKSGSLQRPQRLLRHE